MVQLSLGAYFHQSTSMTSIIPNRVVSIPYPTMKPPRFRKGAFSSWALMMGSRIAIGGVPLPKDMLRIRVRIGYGSRSGEVLKLSSEFNLTLKARFASKATNNDTCVWQPPDRSGPLDLYTHFQVGGAKLRLAHSRLKVATFGNV